MWTKYYTHARYSTHVCSGVWRGADVYDGHFPNREIVLDDIEAVRKRDLPLDVYMIDTPWETHYNSWVPNPNQWGDFRDFLGTIKEQGARPIVWITGWMNLHSRPGDTYPDPQSEQWALQTAPPYHDFAERGLLVETPSGAPYVFDWWHGTGSSVDFTTEEGRDAWADLAKPAMAQGIYGVKTDGMEGFYFDNRVRFGDGTSGAQSAWRNAVGYRQATIDALRRVHGDDWALVGRAGGHGISALGFTWAGDQWATWAGLREVVGAGLSAGLSGISNWTHDVGGYFGRPPRGDEVFGRILENGWTGDIEDLLFGFPIEGELLVRWSHVGAVTPLFQFFSRESIEPWNYSPEVDAAVREAPVVRIVRLL